MRFHKQRGSILILVLWSLVVLASLAVTMAIGIRQKIQVVSSIEQRAKVSRFAEAGIKKALKILKKNDGVYPSVQLQTERHNNPVDFSHVDLGEGFFSVYHLWHSSPGNIRTRFGVEDEGGKINVNKADVLTLKTLFKGVLNVDDAAASDLAYALVDWRQYGETQVEGFYSDEYYSNLQDSYEKKSKPYEVLDELLLVKGVTPAILERLKPYITIYGDGLVNINAANEAVLVALGLSEEVAEKLLVARRGKDGLDSTLDDFLFLAPYDVAGDTAQLTKLDPEEIKEIDQLNLKKKIKVNSSFYLLRSLGRLENVRTSSLIECVYSVLEGKIVYWKQKFVDASEYE